MEIYPNVLILYLMISLLVRKIACIRTLTLINRCIKVPYINMKDKGVKIKSNIGVPQGSVISPLLANIVLHELDTYVENTIKNQFEKGKVRARNKEYQKLTNFLRGNYDKMEERRKAYLRSRQIPSIDTKDPNFRRLKYIRYADDFIILIIGNKKEAYKIRSEIEIFLKGDCGLTLNLEKTTINTLTKGFNFLGAHCRKLLRSDYFVKNKRENTSFRRRITPKLFVTAPILDIINKLIKTKFARRNHKGKLLAKGKQEMIYMDHCDILRFFNHTINGFLNYYSFAGNRSSLHRIF
jgi:Reverse transcriptase (RNA-dependent DNA polymerase)/Type II intron maturase